MSVLIITGNDYEHRYVANAICAAHDVSRILVCAPPPRRRLLTILRRSPLLFLDKMARGLVLSAIGDAATRRTHLREVFGAQSAAPSTARAPRAVVIIGHEIVERDRSGARSRECEHQPAGQTPHGRVLHTYTR